jgi:arylsulfatase A-like enzyme
LANIGNFNSVFDKVILDKVGYPELLGQAGYSVNYVGKWHLPLEGNKEFWHFDESHTEHDYIHMLVERGLNGDRAMEVQRLEWGGQAPFCGRSRLSAEDLQEAWVADKTIDLLERRSKEGKPFMIFSSFFGPHFPYAVPAPYDSMYDPKRVERWINFEESFDEKPLIQQKEMLRWNASHLTWEDWQKVVAHYWGYVTYIDDQIQRILTKLDSLGLAENTLVVYTTDHGDMLGSHRLFNKGMNMYDEIFHIPMIIHWPGVTQAGSINNAFVNLVDLTPTLLDAAGAKFPARLDGRSLIPLLKGETVADWPDDVYAEYHGYESALCSQRMVRTNKWKYIYNPCFEDELYDVVSDPGELRNLAGKLGYKHVLRRMKAQMVNWLSRTGDTIGEDDSWKGSSYDLYLSEREK